MEDMFDISGILSEEDAKKLFEETDPGETTQNDEKSPDEEINENHDNAEETEEEDPNSPEKVGDNKMVENEEDVVDNKSRGSSPTILSSIASALKEDGIFPDFDDNELSEIKTAEDFANLVEKAIDAKFDEKTRRINDILNSGVAPNVVKQYEQTLSYLNSISEEALSAEGEEGEELRKQMIYNDLINRGYNRERALRELEKSFKSGSDIDDAIDAVEALKSFYETSYKKIQDDAKQKTQRAKELQKKQEADFRKIVLEDDITIGDSKLDKKTKQKIFDAVSRPVYKDPETGQILTAVQKFQKENPLEFLKQLGMWYVLTNEGKDVMPLVKSQVQKEKNKGIRELERKLKGNTFDLGGSMRFDGDGGSNGDDLLLSDDWDVVKE